MVTRERERTKRLRKQNQSERDQAEAKMTSGVSRAEAGLLLP